MRLDQWVGANKRKTFKFGSAVLHGLTIYLPEVIKM